eukprot:TRINITY_DN1803_c0_g1_i2.p1 TRINITY_DN1803_c0_g1~~TRINITY_DN1803_c0_g1_i2.p1  ORF type:complete len:156 (-),score=10.13 TRINITY_DN1803_c0_g1_i2:60-479(-)
MTWTEHAILSPADNQFGDKFGRSVALYGNNDKTHAIVGAYINKDLGTNAGAAYLYSLCNDEWSESQKIYGSDTDTDDRFGGAVAISDTEVNIGAYGKMEQLVLSTPLIIKICVLLHNQQWDRLMMRVWPMLCCWILVFY